MSRGAWTREFLGLAALVLTAVWVKAQAPVAPGWIEPAARPAAGSEAFPLPDYLAAPTVGTAEMPRCGLPCAPPAGVFAILDGTLLTPHGTQLGFLGGGDPGVKLGWTVAPQVTLGYRTEGGHALLASYRYLHVQGDAAPVGDPFAAETFHADAEAHWLDLDYLSRRYNPCGSLGLQWETGLRLIYLRYHSRDTVTVNDPFAAELPPFPISPQVTNNKATLAVLGPHLGLDPSWSFGDTGLAVVGRVDLGVLVGGVDLTRSDAVGIDSLSTTKAFLDTRLELGLSWTAPWQRPWLRFAAGYEYEGTFWLGQSGGTLWLSRTFSDHGPFLRCEVAY